MQKIQLNITSLRGARSATRQSRRNEDTIATAFGLAMTHAIVFSIIPCQTGHVPKACPERESSHFVFSKDP
ncbi:MAG: hypothetical protein K0R76_461 [Alphaproteobacteria bacterium]|nr:hypothetical protein [Alphaproteobacteria bacterium]